MARCGCNAASATTCDAIVLCVAANLGPGLRYDSVTGLLAVRLSADAGNSASYGTDGGVYVPGAGASPDPVSGRKTIAGLPDRIAGASSTGGGSMTPFGSPDGLDYGIANRLDLINISTYALIDGVAIARWEGPNSALSNRTDNPASIATKLISSVQLPSLLVDAGARDTPTGRSSGAPTSLLSPDGGWFGFYARNYAPITLTDALNQVAARSVVYLAIYAGVTETELEGFLTGAINAVIQARAQQWTLVSVPGYMSNGSGGTVVSPYADWRADVTGAGMTPVLDLFDDASGGFTITPSQAVAAGFTWVRLASNEVNGGTSLARIQTFIDAGLQVLVQVRSSRQFEVAQMYSIGARGVTTDNPVYSRGARAQTGDLAYRKTAVIPGLVTRTMMEGALTRQTNTGSSSTDIGWARQGSDGRYFSAKFGWVGGIGAHLHSQLLGEMCPYQVTSDYQLRLRFRVDPTQTSAPSGSAPKLGLFFNAPTDQDITYYEPSAAPAYLNGYWATIRVGTSNPGLVVLGKFNDGVFTVLNSSIDLPAIVIGTWIYFTVRVTPTTVSLTVGHNGAPQTVTVNDSDHRGAYAFYGWEDDYVLPADNNGFAHGYSAHESFATGFPMYQDLS